MKKIILIDGNNLLFRSYYATAYMGVMMRNSKGFVTNALYGFASMLNKIINEEKPQYMLVAFDKGKTFRHDLFKGYKEGRIETPDDLLKQFPVAKELLDALGIAWCEVDNYEADDIIGTIAKQIDNNGEFDGLIISSDKDLLQLISNKVSIKLLKQKDYLKLDINNFKEVIGIDPINIIDLKALQGDSSDNIPGVKGIGEKTALKLISEYQTIDNLYNNIDAIGGKLKDKLIDDKENAFFSKHLATIYKDIQLNIDLEELKLEKDNEEKLYKIYQELEFFSMIKKMDNQVKPTELDYKILKNIDELVLDKEVAIYIELDGLNYHTSNILGVGIYSEHNACYMPVDLLKENKDLFNKLKIGTYDIKKNIVSLNKLDIKIDNCDYDLMLAAYLLNYNLKSDIAYLARKLGYDVNLKSGEDIEKEAVLKAKVIYETKKKFLEDLKKEEMDVLFSEIEFPLSYVLADMEITGIRVDRKVLADMNSEIKIKMELLEKEIYNYAGEEFNILSTQQLGAILFDKLNLIHGKKKKTGFSTDKGVLDKLKNSHPIIPKIIEYRTLAKLFSTYVEGLDNYILEDGKIHTIYTQVLARTGRLSSTEPNLQNIPIRYEYGRLIRKAFIPDNDEFMSGDYSQIELRILAHMSLAPNLVEAFSKNIDIHTKTAMDIFDVEERYVTNDMRRSAKAVNFGIVYGISSFGLSNNLDIDVKEAKKFIDKYLNTFTGIKDYLDKVVAKAKEDGFVKTMFNRKRTIEELQSKNYMIRSQGERMALNAPIQGTSADIIKKAMIKIFSEFKKENIKSKMLLQVHDELVFDIFKEEKIKVEAIVKECMENVIELKVPIKVEIDYGKNWYATK